MRLLCCRNVLMGVMLAFGSGMTATADAGLIPWAYNSIFGPSPMYGYGYGAPAYGYSAGYRGAYPVSSYYSPAWSTYTAGYGPSFSYSAFGGNMGAYTYANPCASCGCNPCCTDGCATGNCASGNCASGNCGAGYTPDINNGPTPEPTHANPPATNPNSTIPPTANPPVNNDRNPPIDDFTRVPPRTNDSTIPRSDFPESTVPPGGIPNRNVPNAIPDTNNNPSAPPFNNNLEPEGLFERPTERTPAPLEPSNPNRTTPESTDVFPLGTELLPAPLEVESVPVASIKIERRRIVTQAGYRITAAARLPVAPRFNSEVELAHR